MLSRNNVFPCDELWAFDGLVATALILDHAVGLLSWGFNNNLRGTNNGLSNYWSANNLLSIYLPDWCGYYNLSLTPAVTLTSVGILQKKLEYYVIICLGKVRIYLGFCDVVVVVVGQGGILPQT